MLEPLLIGPAMRPIASDFVVGGAATKQDPNGGNGNGTLGPDQSRDMDLHGQESVRIDREEVLQSWECLFALQHHTLAYSSGRLRRAEAARRNVASLQRLLDSMKATRQRTRQIPLAELSYEALLSRALAADHSPGPGIRERTTSPPSAGAGGGSGRDIGRAGSGKRPPPPARQRQTTRSSSSTNVGSGGIPEEAERYESAVGGESGGAAQDGLDTGAGGSGGMAAGISRSSSYSPPGRSSTSANDESWANLPPAGAAREFGSSNSVGSSQENVYGPSAASGTSEPGGSGGSGGGGGGGGGSAGGNGGGARATNSLALSERLSRIVIVVQLGNMILYFSPHRRACTIRRFCNNNLAVYIDGADDDDSSSVASPMSSGSGSSSGPRSGSRPGSIGTGSGNLSGERIIKVRLWGTLSGNHLSPRFL